MKKFLSLFMALMMISLSACANDTPTQNDLDDSSETSQYILEEVESQDESTETTTSEASSEEIKEETSKPVENSESNKDTIRSDFKKAMDSYEEFIDEYVAFMKKYANNPTDLSLLADYSDYMSKYSDFVEDFEKWESEDLNSAELAYYIDVQARVSKKLLEVAQ